MTEYTEKTNKREIKLKGQHNFILFYLPTYCLYVMDPANFPTSNSVLGTLCSSENSLFFQLFSSGKISLVSLPH